MTDSIFLTIKQMIGGFESYTYESADAFDLDLLIHINTALSILCQIGVGPEDGFSITGSEETWEDFVSNRPDMAMIKSYVYMQVRLYFDTSDLNTGLVQSMKDSIKELEWRLKAAAEERE